MKINAQITLSWKLTVMHKLTKSVAWEGLQLCSVWLGSFYQCSNTEGALPEAMHSRGEGPGHSFYPHKHVSVYAGRGIIVSGVQDPL